jgi:hypothetical protein
LKISMQTLQEFNQYGYTYFMKEREGTTSQVVENLQIANQSLFRKIKKVEGKEKTQAYIGGTLLTRL